MSNLKGKGVIIQLNCHIPSTNVAAIPRKLSSKLSADDRKVVVAQASRVLPKSFFNALHNAVNDCVNQLLKFSVKMGRGRTFFVPVHKIDEAYGICETLETEFNAIRSNKLASYNQTVRDHADTLEDDSLKDFVMKHARSLEYIEDRISADWLPIPVAIDELSDDLKQKWQGKSESLTHQLFREIAEECADSLKNLTGKDRVGMRTNDKLKRIQDKVEGLAFLDPRLQPLADYIGNYLNGLPKEGMLEGKMAADYISLIFNLSDPDVAQKFAEGLGTITPPVTQPTLVHMPKPKPTPPATVEVETNITEEDVADEPVRRFNAVAI